MRIAYHANAEQARQEFEQIKWGLVSIAKKDFLRERDMKERQRDKKDN